MLGFLKRKPKTLKSSLFSTMSKDACVQAEVMQNASIFIGTEQQNQQVLWDILDPNFSKKRIILYVFFLFHSKLAIHSLPIITVTDKKLVFKLKLNCLI